MSVSGGVLVRRLELTGRNTLIAHAKDSAGVSISSALNSSFWRGKRNHRGGVPICTGRAYAPVRKFQPFLTAWGGFRSFAHARADGGLRPSRLLSRSWSFLERGHQVGGGVRPQWAECGPSQKPTPAARLRRFRSYAELEATRGRHTCLGTPRPNFRSHRLGCRIKAPPCWRSLALQGIQPNVDIRPAEGLRLGQGKIR